jgi:hypothetical protein
VAWKEEAAVVPRGRREKGEERNKEERENEERLTRFKIFASRANYQLDWCDWWIRGERRLGCQSRHSRQRDSVEPGEPA